MRTEQSIGTMPALDGPWGWYLTDTTNRGNNVVNFIKGSKGLAGSSSLLAVTLLLLSLVGGYASAASTATIDKMTLKPFGGYMQTYTPGYGITDCP